MDIIKEFLAHITTQPVRKTSTATLGNFCDWSRQQAVEIDSEEYLRGFSGVLIDICTSIKIGDGKLNEHCRKMARDLYFLSMELKDNLKEWEHAIGEEKIKKSQKQASQTQDQLLDWLKKFDQL